MRTYSDNVDERGKENFLATEISGEGDILVNVDESQSVERKVRYMLNCN